MKDEGRHPSIGSGNGTWYLAWSAFLLPVVVLCFWPPFWNVVVFALWYVLPIAALWALTTWLKV